MNSITHLSPGQLRQAANIQERIQELQKKLGQILGSEVSGPAAGAKAPRQRRMSAAGRRAIAAAARARWARIKGSAPKKRRLSAQGLANIRAGVAKRMAAQGKAGQKAKRKLSAAGRAAISAAAKARWAKARAAGRTKL
jgi:hypothetical protein